jgi:hypothetical protein
MCGRKLLSRSSAKNRKGLAGDPRHFRTALVLTTIQSPKSSDLFSTAWLSSEAFRGYCRDVFALLFRL